MITLYPVLRQRIRQTGTSWAKVATAAGISPFKFYLKMWGIKGWTLTDMVRICAFFRTPDGEHLFVRNHSKSQLLESQGKNYHV